MDLFDRFSIFALSLASCFSSFLTSTREALRKLVLCGPSGRV
jgi:hypothetical protein